MYEDLIEKKLKSEDIFDGNLLHVKRDTALLPNGEQATREWIKHPGASAVIPYLPDGQIILVRQYRYPVQRVTLEIPAGKLDGPDEDPYVCAVRELSEETGYTAKTIEKLTTIGTTVGFSNEYIHIYKAEGLTPEETEILTDACKIYTVRGKKVRLVAGSPTNMKITYADDLPLAEAILRAQGE